MPEDGKSFIKVLSASEGGLWISLAANLLQIGEWLWGHIAGGPDTDRVLRILDDISAQIAETYLGLRDLILRETARIIDRINVVAYKQESAKARSAYSNLKEYRRAGNRDILEMAFTLSSEPTAFFLSEESLQSIASFIYSVQVRIDVLRSFIKSPSPKPL
jgi:hypothetical protein